MERLSALDMTSIWPQERGWSNDITTVAARDLDRGRVSP